MGKWEEGILVDEGVLHVEPELGFKRKGVTVLLHNGQKQALPEGTSWVQDNPMSETGWSRLHVYDAEGNEIAVFEPGAYGAVLYY